MKSRKGHIGFLIFGISLLVGFFTPLIPNLWGIVIDNEYVIPKESSLFTFKVTRMNEGSGDYWLYGEDKTYFYSKMLEGPTEPYIKISRKKANSKKTFNKHDFTTWNNANE